MQTPCYGNYRAEVVENKDPEKKGRIKLWIPDLMPNIDKLQGIWALSANNSIGGRNEDGSSNNYYAGQCLIPPKGSWVWIFFECGDVSRPWYFGSCDLENTKVLPENQVGKQYQNKWTLFKSPRGRTIVISDDPSDCRVEITGKKRKLKRPPTGNKESVYDIDDNQTVILLDERVGRQKLLIRTYRGDFLKINIDERKLEAEFKGGIDLISAGDINILSREKIVMRARQIETTSEYNTNIKTVLGNINLNATTGKINTTSLMSTNMKSLIGINQMALSINSDALLNISQKAGLDISSMAAGMVNHTGGVAIANDAPMMLDNTGASMASMFSIFELIDINIDQKINEPDGNRECLHFMTGLLA